MEKQLKILSIGAHPDDADTYSGGLLSKLRDAGWLVRLLSVTDGSAGTYHMDESAFHSGFSRRGRISSITSLFFSFNAPFASIIYRRNTWHSK